MIDVAKQLRCQSVIRKIQKCVKSSVSVSAACSASADAQSRVNGNLRQNFAHQKSPSALSISFLLLSSESCADS